MSHFVHTHQMNSICPLNGRIQSTQLNTLCSGFVENTLSGGFWKLFTTGTYAIIGTKCVESENVMKSTTKKLSLSYLFFDKLSRGRYQAYMLPIELSRLGYSGNVCFSASSVVYFNLYMNWQLGINYFNFKTDIIKFKSMLTLVASGSCSNQDLLLF